MGMAGLFIPVIQACSKSDPGPASSSSSTSSTSSSGTCATAPAETAGPYPKDLSANSAIFRNDITEGKTGIPLSLILTIVNSNANCALLSSARVDIWHCDKDGYYSAYNSQPGYLGTQNNAGSTFFRGIQLTDSNGQARFTTIYPGWYSGRVTHIHVEVFINSVLKATTQLAFPDSLTTTVYNILLYSAHGQNSIKNASDGIFSDSYNSEMLTITGDVSNGFIATFQIGVAI